MAYGKGESNAAVLLSDKGVCQSSGFLLKGLVVTNNIVPVKYTKCPLQHSFLLLQKQESYGPLFIRTIVLLLVLLAMVTGSSKLESFGGTTYSLYYKSLFLHKPVQSYHTFKFMLSWKTAISWISPNSTVNNWFCHIEKQIYTCLHEHENSAILRTVVSLITERVK